MTSHPFVTGGPVPPNSPVYIERYADKKARRHLTRMEYITLIEPRQQGKTSLIYRLAQTLGPDYVFAYANTMRLDKTDEAAWYASLCRKLLPKIRFISQTERLSFPYNGSTWGDFMTDLAKRAEAAKCNLVIDLDELGDVWMDWRIGFFSNIRAIFDERPDETCLQHLTFILAGAYNPRALISDPRTSPFNVAQRVHLPDFTLTQTNQIVTHLGLPTEDALAIAQRIRYWTDGQPYLTQRLCRTLAEGEAPATPEGVDIAVDQLYREDINHLPRILEALDSEKHSRLRKYVERVLSGHHPQFRPSSEGRYHGPLALIGVVKVDEDGLCKVRNRIYERALQGADEILNESSKPPAPPSDPPPHRPSSGTTYHITITGDGNVVGDGSGAQVIHREPSSVPETVSPPGVSVTLLTRIFPTAYCHNLTAETFPLVTIVLDNTGRGCDNAQVSAEAVVQGYSEPAVASLLVPRGQQAQIALLPMLRHKAVATLNEIRPASLRVTIHQHHAGRSQLLHDQTYPLQLHARDTALLAVKAPDGSTVDLTDYLVAWVTPRRPEIERLLRQAVEHYPDRQFIGYQGASTLAEAAVVVREQARAIFAVLKQDANLVYINSPLNLGTQDGQVTQRVRLPTESLAAGSSANCIDGTVLFASLLELASIEPLIVLVPRHAFVGWRIWSGVNRYEFLETTMIGNADFDAAQKSAQARYEEVLLKGYLSRGLFDSGGFARLIDVAACRTKGIHPLE